MGDLGLFSLQKTKLRKDLSLCLQLPNEGGDAQQKDKKKQTQITKKALTKFRGNIFTRWIFLRSLGESDWTLKLAGSSKQLDHMASKDPFPKLLYQ